MILRYLLMLMMSRLLVACSTEPEDYQHTAPDFAFREFFTGPLKAWGIVTDFRGKLRRRFTADIDASWQGDQLTLDEHFTYLDGEQQQRTWTITLDKQQLVGQAADVTGEATGQIVGAVMNWSYTLNLPLDDENWQFNVDDWLYRIDDNVVINTGTLYKFGLPVAHITLMMQKQ